MVDLLLIMTVGPRLKRSLSARDPEYCQSLCRNRKAGGCLPFKGKMVVPVWRFLRVKFKCRPEAGVRGVARDDME